MRQIDMHNLHSYEPLPWPQFEIPEYRIGEGETWVLKPGKTPPLIRGYYTGLQPMIRDNMVLAHKGSNKVWMSITPMETESQSMHMVAATGHTVIAGCGMGVLLYNVLKKPEVTKVTLLEKDPDVITVLRGASDIAKWNGIEKLNIVICDALEYEATEPVDFLAVDIWLGLGEYRALPDTQQMCMNIYPKAVGYWGQELDFITFMQSRNLPVRASWSVWCDFLDHIKIPLIGTDFIDYPYWCIMAGLQMYLAVR